MAKAPEMPGPHWAAFDDGDRIVEIALLNVMALLGERDLARGAEVRFVDETHRYFTMGDMGQRLVRPGREVALGSVSFSPEDRWRITWLGPARRPGGAPRVGDALAESTTSMRVGKCGDGRAARRAIAATDAPLATDQGIAILDRHGGGRWFKARSTAEWHRCLNLVMAGYLEEAEGVGDQRPFRLDREFAAALMVARRAEGPR